MTDKVSRVIMVVGSCLGIGAAGALATGLVENSGSLNANGSFVAGISIALCLYAKERPSSKGEIAQYLLLLVSTLAFLALYINSISLLLIFGFAVDVPALRDGSFGYDYWHGPMFIFYCVGAYALLRWRQVAVREEEK